MIGNVVEGSVKGDKQLIFFYCEKPTLAQVIFRAKEVFEGKDFKDLKILAGYANFVITEGDDFDVPKI
jgi:hypothetical protein